MNTYVNIGSSQDFRLTRALLIYGTSSYDGFPYRHPFVTLHEVIHDNDGVRLGEGQLATPQMLVDLDGPTRQVSPSRDSAGTSARAYSGSHRLVDARFGASHVFQRQRWGQHA